MRNKLTRRNHAGLGEIQSRVVTQSDVNLLLSPVESGSDAEAVSKKDSARLSDDTNNGGECMSTRAAERQVISNIYKLQPEESQTSKLGVCVMRATQHARAEPVCKQHRDQDRLYGLLTKPVSLRGESFQSFQSKRSSPKHCLNQRYEAITPACSPQSDSSPHNCLEEIKKSNPTFPARRVFRFLQKKSSENKCNLISPVEKRKRQHEVNVPDKDFKRQRKAVVAETTTCRPSETGVPSTEAVQGHSRLSRTQRLKRLKRGAGLCDTPQLTPKTESETEAISYGPNTEASISDVLWTEKYSPLHSSEVIGNSSSVNKVHSWLKKWRWRVDGYDQKEEAERKRPHDDYGLWDCGAFQGEAGSEGETVEQLSTTLLITGPTGSGKTASVYACALELGFKVFEVNCSSQRSGRCVLAQLKEVTQSHLVEAPGKEALRPAYYNNYYPHNSRSKPDALPGKNSSKATVATSKRRPGPHQGRSRRTRPPDSGVATLTSFFKTTVEDPAVVASPPLEDHQEPCHFATRPAGRRDLRTAAMSLVLFEEVDVIFDDDLGFLSAIKTLMTTTKRPVVLTTSDPLFKERFESDVEEILFKTPLAVNVCSYLRLVCLAENARTQQHEVAGLLAECQGDLRRCLLQLHFLVKSSMGRRPLRTGLPRQSVLGGSDRTKDGEERVKCIPLPADTAGYSVSCVNTLTKRNILHLLKCQSWAEPENELLTVLTERWRRHFPLLYSNLELLLPLPASTQGTTNCCPDKDPKAGTNTEPSAPATASQRRVQQQGQQLGENIDLKAASSSTMRTCLRNTSRLSRRKGILTLTDCSRSSPNSALQPPQTEGQRSLEGTHLEPQGSVDKSGDKGIRASTHRGLEALAHFVDLMSYLDSTVENVEPHVSGPCVAKDFFWTGAEVKDGLLDEMREGGGERTWRQLERLSEIQAAVEGLGFHVYRGRVSAASSGTPTWRQEVGGVEWEEPVDRLSLPGSTPRLSSGGHLLPQHSMAQRRFELSRAVLQNRGFSLLGSRRAVCLDYMSTLRSICHHQLQEHGSFQNYLRSIHLGLSNTTMQQLAEECME